MTDSSSVCSLNPSLHFHSLVIVQPGIGIVRSDNRLSRGRKKIGFVVLSSHKSRDDNTINPHGSEKDEEEEADGEFSEDYWLLNPEIFDRKYGRNTEEKRGNRLIPWGQLIAENQFPVQYLDAQLESLD